MYIITTKLGHKLNAHWGDNIETIEGQHPKMRSIDFSEIFAVSSYEFLASGLNKKQCSYSIPLP